jgi:hypothetical protein
LTANIEKMVCGLHRLKRGHVLGGFQPATVKMIVWRECFDRRTRGINTVVA